MIAPAERVSDEVLQDWAKSRADDAGRLARELIDRRAADAELRKVCETTLAAVWDAHYGHGITVGYARAIDAEVKAAIAAYLKL